MSRDVLLPAWSQSLDEQRFAGIGISDATFPLSLDHWWQISSQWSVPTITNQWIIKYDFPNSWKHIVALSESNPCCHGWSSHGTMLHLFCCWWIFVQLCGFFSCMFVSQIDLSISAEAICDCCDHPSVWWDFSIELLFPCKYFYTGSFCTEKPALLFYAKLVWSMLDWSDHSKLYVHIHVSQSLN